MPSILHISWESSDCFHDLSSHRSMHFHAGILLLTLCVMGQWGGSMASNTTDICLNVNLIFRMTENCQVGKDSWFEKFGVENRHKRSENAGYQLKHHTIAEKKKYTKKSICAWKAAPTQQSWTRACILNMYQFRHDNSLWRKIKAWFKHELP